MQLGQPNLEVFASTLLDLANERHNIVVLTSDSRGSGQLTAYAQAVPDQLVEVGIAEQDLVGIAAGLASSGKAAFAVSPACFLTARSLEQIKNDVAYSDHPVKLIGISAGVSYGALGTTHHSLHDFAVLRAIHNMTIVSPADNVETREAIRAAVDYPHPLYIRFGKKAVYDLHQPGARFEIGKAITLSTGTDVTFIATGEAVYRAVQACDILKQNGLSCGVISMHTVKPLDVEAVLDAGRYSKAIITVEEHSVFGGLGEACAAVLLQHGLLPAFRIVGIPDEYTVAGSQSEVFEHYGITPHGLASTAQQLLRSSVVPVR